MQITVTTWNINSVRFRIDLVAKFIKTARPDILCLQETKCPDDRFPRKRFKRLGYDNIALNGQKGYHGVVVLSRLPFERSSVREFCGKNDCRHISITLGERAGLSDPITLHNLYVPAGGDVPDPAINAKFAHKLAFLDEMQACEMLRPAVGERSIIVGDLNVAPLECDVWSHKQLLSVVSHTPIECEKLTRRAADRRLDRRGTNLCAGAGAGSTHGGVIGRRTGPNPTRAAASTISGRRVCWRTVFRISRSPRITAARGVLPTTCR